MPQSMLTSLVETSFQVSLSVRSFLLTMGSMLAQSVLFLLYDKHWSQDSQVCKYTCNSKAANIQAIIADHLFWKSYRWWRRIAGDFTALKHREEIWCIYII